MISPENIIVIVSDYFHTPMNEVLSTCRKEELVRSRQVSMYFVRRYTKLSLSDIGKHFPGRTGYKNHATIIHACKSVNNRIDTDKFYARDIDSLNRKIVELFNIGSALTPIETEEERFERIWNERERILISENKHLKNEISNLKNEISKLQGRIYGMKLSKSKPIRETKVKLPLYDNPFTNQ